MTTLADKIRKYCTVTGTDDQHEYWDVNDRIVCECAGWLNVSGFCLPIGEGKIRYYHDEGTNDVRKESDFKFFSKAELVD
jgi:hypothetical protein